MSDIIRDLYFWQTTQINPKTEETDELKQARDELDPLYQKIVHALNTVYGDAAKDIENDWYGALASVYSEEAFQVFKEGMYIGFDIAMTMMNH